MNPDPLIFTDEWDEAMKDAFAEGYTANSIHDNPYWKQYPKDASSFEESRARHWVDGYYNKLKENNAPAI